MLRLVETATIDPKLFKKVELNNALREKLNIAIKERKLTEAITDETTAWEVPISRYDQENANGRIYPRALWERVLREQRHIWEGAPMLADHPSADSDGDPSRICGVWLEARIGNDGYVYGTFLPSGSLGRDMQEHLRNGLRAGTSSSGFGELLHDNKTVNPDTYIIERLSDWVLTPSQGTYFTYEATTRETKNASDSRLGESANKLESVVKENIPTMKITKLEEKKFRKDMEAFLEDAQKIVDPQERLKEFEEILTYFDEGAAPDLRERVVAKINEQREQIQAQLREAEKLEKELGIKNTDELKEKLTNIVEDADILHYEATDWKEIAASLQKKLDEAREELQERPTTAYTTHLRNKIKKLYAEKKLLERNINAQKAKMSAAAKKKNALLEAIDGEISDYKNKLLAEQRHSRHLKAQIERLQKQIKEDADKLKEVTAAFQNYKNKVEAAPKLEASPALNMSKYLNFREEDAINSYWADLVVRHGVDIKPYEKKILSAKTVREAMSNYMRILPFLNESKEYEAARIPESVAISLKERGALLEKAGARMAPASLEERLPQGWV